jgi:hypothetical protein
MRPIIRASVLALGALLVGSADASAQIWRRTADTPQNGVCFYENSNFRGQYFCSDTNTQNPMIGMNDRISSLRVFGNASVTVFQDREFLGRSQTFSNDVTDLSQDGWNDTITSVRVRAGRSTGTRFGRSAVPANGACFYENVNFTGDYFCSTQGETVEMVPQGTNDRISSIRLLGNAELVVFRDRDFQGTSQWFDGSARDLRESGWNDTISSYRIESRGAFRGRGYGRGRGGDYGRDTYDYRRDTGGYYEPANGSLEWRGRVDDRVQLVIRGRSVQERTVSGATMDSGRAAFSSGLPAQPVRVNVRMLAGRGDVRVIQQPSRQNGYTAIIEVVDPARGAQEQRLQVIWG